MNKMEKIKLAFVSFFTAVNTWLGILSVPMYILVAVNIIDYITGIAASSCKGQAIESRIGYRGIAKKVSMWLLVAIGAIMDYLMVFATASLGVDTGIKYMVAIAVVIWLLANELISILENISDIGTPLPPFLLKLIQLLKDKTQEL